MFEKFQEYMYYLLTAPLKKIVKISNQFYILCKVFGKIFDRTLQDIYLVREQSMVISALPIFLTEHGKDRDMPQLNGEDAEAYRTRLCMRGIIAEKAGTDAGILLALKALGYEKSTIEPYYYYDQDRWAEFIIYLKGSNPTITDINIINNEVLKVKAARSKPVYESEDYNEIQIQSSFSAGLNPYPLCGNTLCGTYPQ